jgi:hypothetical protein
MFTLKRLSMIGLAAGLVTVGCASPTDETNIEPIDQASAAVTAQATNEQTPQDAFDEQAAAALPTPEIAEAMAGTDPAASAEDVTAEDEMIGQKADEIIMGGGFGMPFGGFGLGRVGFGGFGMPFGGLGFGRVGFGGFGFPGFGLGGFGVPFGGFGLGGFGVPFGGFGLGGFGVPFGGFGGFGMPLGGFGCIGCF